MEIVEDGIINGKKQFSTMGWAKDLRFNDLVGFLLKSAREYGLDYLQQAVHVGFFTTTVYFKVSGQRNDVERWVDKLYRMYH